MHCVNSAAAANYAAQIGIEQAREAAVEMEVEALFQSTFSPYIRQHLLHAVEEMPETYQALIAVKLKEGNEESAGKLLHGWVKSYWYGRAYDYAEKHIDDEVET